MFFTCKQVSNHLSKEDYDKLPPLQKASLKFHVWWCPICGAYNKQVMKMYDMTRVFRGKTEEQLETDSSEAPKLSDDARKRFEEAMNQAKNDPEAS